MKLEIVFLLGIAALAHALWNLAAKQSRDKQVFFFLSLVVSALLYLPLFLKHRAHMSRSTLVFATMSGGLEALYYSVLGAAYSRADLSLVYPLVRGTAVVFVLLGARFLLNESISALGAVGVLVILLGVYITHIESFDRTALLRPVASLFKPGSRLALLTGLITASYSLLDKVGVQTTHPAAYIYLVFFFAMIWLFPYVLATKREHIRIEWRQNGRQIVFVGIVNLAAYLCALHAMTLSKLSYVSSVREISVVFGALMGSHFLKERFGAQKTLGAMLVFCGIVLISRAR